MDFNMNKKYILAITAAALFVPSVYAQSARSDMQGHWAIEGAIGTSGTVGVNFSRYEHAYEFGAGIGGVVNNSSSRTSLFTVSAYAGLRNYIAENTVFAYGLNLGTKFGRDSGDKVNSVVSTGPYVSIEQYLTEHVVASVWINPYYYEYEKKAGVGKSTNRFLSSGGVSFSYHF